MRVLFGILIGALLTIGGAYISDSWSTGPASATTTVEHRPMVNWDVVGENFRVVRERANEAWNRLSHKLSS
jgi:hypothetical protein